MKEIATSDDNSLLRCDVIQSLLQHSVGSSSVSGWTKTVHDVSHALVVKRPNYNGRQFRCVLLLSYSTHFVLQ